MIESEKEVLVDEKLSKLAEDIGDIGRTVHRILPILTRPRIAIYDPRHCLRDRGRYWLSNCLGRGTRPEIRIRLPSRAGGILTFTYEMSSGWNNITVLGHTPRGVKRLYSVTRRRGKHRAVVRIPPNCYLIRIQLIDGRLGFEWIKLYKDIRFYPRRPRVHILPVRHPYERTIRRLRSQYIRLRRKYYSLLRRRNYLRRLKARLLKELRRRLAIKRKYTIVRRRYIRHKKLARKYSRGYSLYRRYLSLARSYFIRYHRERNPRRKKYYWNLYRKYLTLAKRYAPRAKKYKKHVKSARKYRKLAIKYKLKYLSTIRRLKYLIALYRRLIAKLLAEIKKLEAEVKRLRTKLLRLK